MREAAGAGVLIFAGIGVDVFEFGLAQAMTPDDVADGVNAALDSGADGLTVSRNYAEMRLENIAAVGAVLRKRGLVQA